jgi:hypothetical protein
MVEGKKQRHLHDPRRHRRVRPRQPVPRTTFLVAKAGVHTAFMTVLPATAVGAFTGWQKLRRLTTMDTVYQAPGRRKKFAAVLYPVLQAGRRREVSAP